MIFHLTGPMDYIIAISGMLIIITSFAWNIYDIFLRKSIHHHLSDSEDSGSDQFSDSAIR